MLNPSYLPTDEQARAFGRQLAGQVPDIWHPTNELVDWFRTRARTGLQSPFRTTRDIKIGRWWAWGFFLAGLGSFAAIPSAPPLFLLWFLFSGLWIWSVAELSRMKSAAQRTHLMSTKRLVDLATEEAVRHLDQRKNLALSYQQAERQRVAAQQAAEQLERVRARQHPAPEPQPYGVSHEGAESLVAQWMRHLGEGDADTTQYVSDGGIDVASINYIAQVMNYTGTVGVQAVRELAGVAIVDGRKPLFFTSGTFSSGAIEFADQAKIALFEYDAVSGTLQGGNVSGHRFARDGLAAESAQQHSSLVGNEDGGDSR